MMSSSWMPRHWSGVLPSVLKILEFLCHVVDAQIFGEKWPKNSKIFNNLGSSPDQSRVKHDEPIFLQFKGTILSSPPRFFWDF